MTIRSLSITVLASVLGLLAAPAFAQVERVDPSAARSGGCEDWGCGTNGTSVDGVSEEVVRVERSPKRGNDCEAWGCGTNGTSVDGIADGACLPASTKVARPSVDAVVLPNGESVELR